MWVFVCFPTREDMPQSYFRASFNAMLLPHWRKVPESDARSVISVHPNISRDADTVSGQTRANNESAHGAVLIRQLWQSLEEGARKRG